MSPLSIARRVIMLLLACTLIATAPRTQHTTAAPALTSARQFAHIDTYNGTVFQLVAIGDHDEDGISDLAVGLRGNYKLRTMAWRNGGTVRIHSGRDGSLLEELSPDRLEVARSFGYALCALPRTDQPAGLAIASRYADGQGSVSVRHVDGTGLVLRGDGDMSFGWRLCAVGDADDDGQGDLAVGAHGRLSVFSSSTGACLSEWTAPGLGSAFCRIGNRSGEGFQGLATVDVLPSEVIDEFTVEAPPGSLTPVTLVRILSLDDGSESWRFVLDLQGMALADMVSLGDHDGDGVPDVLLALAGSQPESSHLAVLSGATGAVLSDLRFENITYLRSGRLVETLDLDGDGFHDLLYPISEFLGGGRSSSTQVAVVSGRSLSLIARVEVANPSGTLVNRLAALYEGTVERARLTGFALAYESGQAGPGVALVSLDL